MKYRILLSVLLPFIIALGFAAKFIHDDYQNMREMDVIVQLANLNDAISTLTKSLQEESTFSALYLIQEKASYSKNLIEARHRTDDLEAILKQKLAQVFPLLEENVLLGLTQKIFPKLETLNQKRRAIDDRSLTVADTTHYYADIIMDLIASRSYILDSILETNDTEFIRTLFAQTALVLQSLEANQEKTLVFLALLQGQLKQEDYIHLVKSIGQQEAFETVFFDLAISSQDEVYRSMLKGPLVNNAKSLEDTIVETGPHVPLNIEPKTWWEAQAGKVGVLEEIEKKILSESYQAGEARKTSQLWDIWRTIGLILLTFGLTLYFVFRNLRTLANQLQGEIGVLARSGEEILAAVHDASSGTAETATAITETTTTVEELRQTAQVASDKAKHVSEVSDHTLNVLKESEQTLEDTIQGMNRIQEGMGTISESILKLSENSQTIGVIINTVNDLAEQSHLLAVNAAIEAAKAGDQGKGFAVVAQEMRSLAEQSKQATVQVRTILHEIQNSTNAAVMATEQGSKAVANGMQQSAETNQSIHSLAHEISHVIQAATQIAVSIQQQLIGVEQVTIAMGNIKEASHQQVGIMHQIESGIQGLNNVGQSLKEMAQEYRL
jgi:hypothetical protein